MSENIQNKQFMLYRTILSSPSRGLSLAIHLTSVTSFLWSFFWMFRNGNEIILFSYGSFFQHLTVLSLLLSLITGVTASLSDIFLSKVLYEIKLLLQYVCCPLEMLVSFLYWGIALYDRGLLRPDEFEPAPLIFDLSVHIFPTIFLLFDYFFLSPPFKAPVKHFGVFFVLITAGYYYWVERCYVRNKFYAYPLLEYLSTHEKVLLFGFASALSLVFYTVLKSMNIVKLRVKKAHSA
ncbi:fungal protein [Schizosaccharomyces japonicus yFS275]|uniref:Fungal protein n=1 Tax=Schizosaccharomyces japonicus (strain yFS275 / FY16936) TaxID=402676 RepID=B6K764_SCHJY|nr:fungal protein [Schizosaccharomyces japonicus yFS275]EEB09368.2 fungal protein [Schizosaccharomyces japonicus yFS275]